MNLIDKLTKEDLENIQNYRKLFQVNGGSFADALTPVESFLQDWSKSKGTLYKALGNCFRKSITHIFKHIILLNYVFKVYNKLFVL